MTPERFEKARAELSRAVHAFADLSCRAIGLDWLGVPGLPEPVNLSDLIGSTKDGRLRVSEDHCENTIFLDPYDNVAFRAWHDALHIAYECGFSLGEEKVVAHAHVFQCIAMGLSEDVQRIVYADVVRQGEHLETHGTFPENQLAFMRFCLVNE